MRRIYIVFSIILLCLISLTSISMAACGNDENDGKEEIITKTKTIEYDWSVNSTDCIVEMGTTYKLVACYGAEEVSFSVDDESILKITKEGVITPIKTGTAYVTITATNTSKNIVCVVSVTDGGNYQVKFDELGCEFVLKLDAVKIFTVKTFIGDKEYQDDITWIVEQNSEYISLMPNGNSCEFKASKTGTYSLKALSKKGGMATISVLVEE